MPTAINRSHCPAPACGKQIPSYMLGCREHWFQLPYNLRRAITTHYKRGQEIRGDQTPEYMEALKQCIEFWEKKAEKDAQAKAKSKTDPSSP